MKFYYSQLLYLTIMAAAATTTKALSKVCAVFGYGPGVGASVARKWSAEGFSVALLSRKMEKLEQASKDIPNSKGFVCDVTQPESIDDAVSKIESDLGPIDVLVWNAGNGVWKVCVLTKYIESKERSFSCPKKMSMFL